MNQVVIALGSNIEKERNLPTAVSLLKALCHVVAVAPIYETVPVGLLDQPNFWNTAVLIHTPLDPEAIKADIIGHIERTLKRVRQADPNAPRTIDADIILFNDQVGSYAGEDGRLRQIPDKDLNRFVHVALPVSDVLPDGKHPETGELLTQLAHRLYREPFEGETAVIWQVARSLLAPYIGTFQLSGNLEQDVKFFFRQHDCEPIFQHVRAVSIKAKELAEQFGADVQASVQAALLHDISGVIPNSERIDLAKAVGVEVLPEEEAFPMIIHQKLSVVVAQSVFGINDAKVLSAIGCHTTLKATSSLCDHVVFLADKIAWDQSGTPPYLADLLDALETSIAAASLIYINYLWAMRDKLHVVHPWLKEARTYLLQAKNKP